MSWMQTFTGLPFDVLNPHFSKVCIEDIAHSLAMMCRYNGHTLRFYSIAEHCFWGTYYLPEELQLPFLFHDGSEAYTGDIIRPLKYLFKGFNQVEAKIDEEISLAIGYRWPLTKSEKNLIKTIDWRLLRTEQEQIMSTPPMDWTYPVGVESLPITLECWPPDVAEQKFLERYRELTGGQ